MGAYEVQRLGKRLLPVRIEPVKNSDLPPALGGLHVLPVEGVYEHGGHLPLVVETLRRDWGWIQEHTRLVALAERWDQRGRPEALLMSAEDVQATDLLIKQRPDEASTIPQDLIDLLDESRVRIAQEAIRQRRIEDADSDQHYEHAQLTTVAARVLAHSHE
jgi:hypothetical protein